MSRPAPTRGHFLLEKDVPTLLDEPNSSRSSGKAATKTDWRHAGGLFLTALGAVVIVVGYFQLSSTSQTNEQLSYFISGGLGGAAILACGIALLISREHVSDRDAMAALIDRIDRLESELLAELRALRGNQ